VGVNHGVLYWASGCETLWVCWAQCIGIMLCYAEPVVVNQDVLFWVITCESWWGMLSHRLTIIVYYTETVDVKHCYADTVAVSRGDVCWTSGLWVMVCYVVPVVVNHGELCSASSCESWCYAKPVVVNKCAMLNHVCGNYGVLFWASGWESLCECCASGCESLWVMLSQWLRITVCYSVPVGVNHGDVPWGSSCES
jgi:hypothetical protein